MNERNVFDYILLLAVPLIFVYQVIKYSRLFFNYFVNQIELTAAVVKTRKGRLINPFGPFSHVLEYNFKGRILKSYLKGFATPFNYRVGERIQILLNKKDPSQVIAIRPKGQVIRLSVKIIVAILTIFGVIHCLHLLGIIHDVVIVNLIPYGFLILASLMFVHTLYSQYLLRRRSVIVHGTINDMIEVLDNENIKAYKPMIEYTVANRVYHLESEILYYNKQRLGQTVSVIVLIDMPEFGEINSFESKWLHLIFWFLLLLTSLLVILLMIKR